MAPGHFTAWQSGAVVLFFQTPHNLISRLRRSSQSASEPAHPPPAPFRLEISTISLRFSIFPRVPGGRDAGGGDLLKSSLRRGLWPGLSAEDVRFSHHLAHRCPFFHRRASSSGLRLRTCIISVIEKSFREGSFRILSLDRSLLTVISPRHTSNVRPSRTIRQHGESLLHAL